MSSQSKKRYVCIHGHFYQPPRENPWLEDVELQDSAHPFHDWNERITAECYAPNAASRILGREERIVEIVNNYSLISFNFGPTLLSWLERHSPETYRAILEADRQSMARFSGHGSALAQAYNHIIMPLANERDKRTQVRWGVADFEHRFGRRPEGMWLPETAVDTETLEALAGEGILFTVLAPYQARRVRLIGSEKWWSVPGAGIDTRMPYLCRLPSGKAISLFFYDGPVAQKVAFSDLLRKGENLARGMLGGFAAEEVPQLAHIATDGETYGHHHRFGEMALTYCLDYLEKNDLAAITIYGEYLEKHPPTHEVEIAENTSWSCAHGVERWRSDCGCSIGGERGWTQVWRGPLRSALDWLRDRVAPAFEREMASLAGDPWAARDAYIEVALDRSPANVEAFLRRQAGRGLTREERTKALRLLEMQRQAMLMYTSCGWFFDEVSGIETTQILAYAARVLQLAEEACGEALEEEFLRRLEAVPSNVAKWGNAARLYAGQVKPTRLDLIRVAAHHAIASVFDGHRPAERVYCYRAENQIFERIPAGRMCLGIGRTRIRSEITGNEGEFTFAVVHFGEHNLNAGVREFQGEEAFAAMGREVRGAFQRSDLPGVIRLMDRHFGSHNYTLWHLFRDDQRKILNQVMEQTLEDIGISFRDIYDKHFALINFLREVGMPLPAPLAAPVQVVLNSRLQTSLDRDDYDPGEFRALVEEVENLEVSLDRPTLAFAAGRRIESLMDRLAASPEDLELLLTIDGLLALLQPLDLRPNLWKAQNMYCAIQRRLRPKMKRAGAEGDAAARRWLESFGRLGRHLQVSVTG
ncbi:DUF3536 domain-containing protein [uncultured Desulfuromonas sp.]|uniref:DUF3536 domain-containing protein n=1 Tax=uncultured Desulfuromonas sp. TaxID=181013 RepID=UPI00262E091F|nr:DUF3536 domain-containing protein [uncultured Desulfuromonas sp.]